MTESFCPLCHSIFESSGFCSIDGSQLRPIEELGSQWIGKTIHDKYRIVRFLGAGGMAEVYEAEHVALVRRVAIKLLHPRLATDPMIVERFKQEARLISLINHPNVVSVEDFGALSDGTLYMTMELLKGRSLEDYLENGPLEPCFALDIAEQACEGLQAAHDKNIVHRDIKPANLFLQEIESTSGSEDLVVKLLDLGVARLLGQESSSLTVTGTVFGTPEYMSPQQALGQTLDFRSDIYSLGVVLYHMLVGSVPFTAASFLGVLTKHLTQSPTWPKRIAKERGLPSETEAVVMKALQKNPEHRYQSLRELQDALRDLRKHIEACALGTAPTRISIPTAQVASLRSTSTSVHLVPLAEASASDREAVEVAPNIYWVGRRKGGLLECNSYLRVFRGQGTQVALLIDPGPPRDLDVIAAKVGVVLGSINKVDLLFLNHQDPDVCGNASILQQTNPHLHVLCSEDTWRLVQFYGLRPNSYSAIEHFRDGQALLATGHRLSFVPTPYCHFRGAVMLYDHEAQVLFSGDLFGGLSRSPHLIARPEDLPDVEIFHQLYMPSTRALRLALERLRKVDPQPKLIAPQHGGLVSEDRVAAVLERFENLQVGIDLLSSEKDRARFIRLANDIIQGALPLLGNQQVAASLRRFASDGSFPNVFVLQGEHSLSDIKIEPGAALRALVRDLFETASPDQRPALEQLVQQLSQQADLSLEPAPEDRQDPWHVVINVED